MNPIVRDIIRFTRKTTFSDLPANVIEKAKQGVIDFLACTLLGPANAIGKTIRVYVENIGAVPEATVIGAGFKTSRALASLAIGTFSHADDFDDISFSLPGHPSVTVIPAALTIGETEDISGPEFITAYMVGFEIQCKLGQALAPKLYQKGWHATSVLGTLGAAATAGRLLSLSEEQLAHCLGIAASMASGLRANLGTMTKPLHVGFAVHNGVTAALLAQQGVTASLDALEGALGFCQTFADGGRSDKIVHKLGNPYDIITPGILYKRYPSCAETHPALDATIELAHQAEVNPDDVSSIDCVVTPLNHDVLVYSSPRTALEGKFSLHFCVALGLVKRKASLEDFSDDMVSDPAIVRIMQKVTMTPDPSLAEDGYTGAATTVNIHMRDGTRYTKTVYHAKGSPENPLSMQELLAKYQDCASRTLLARAIEATTNQLLHLERMDKIVDLIAQLDAGLLERT